MPLMSQWRKELRANNNTRIYKGRSMEGTFQFGDHLIFEPAPLTGIQPGDVVIYRRLNHKGSHDELVHRVISSLPEGLIVKGDNNPHVDKTLVTEKNLMGRVSHLERNGKRFLVGDRHFGLLRARALHGLRHVQAGIWALVRRMGRSSYRQLRNSGLIGRLWRPSIKKILLLTTDGPLLKYVCRNRTVAYYSPANGRFQCRKPYDLVLCKKKLENQN